MPAHAKYKIIYGRFIVVLLAFLAVYSFLHWWLLLRPSHSWLSLPITHWILPAAIAIVLYIAFLRKRFHLLKLETKPKKGQYHKRQTERRYDNTDFSAVVIPLLAAPVIAAQFFLVDLVTAPFSFTETLSFHATWISGVASCLLLLWLVARCDDDREAWQQWKADEDYPKRFKQ